MTNSPVSDLDYTQAWGGHEPQIPRNEAGAGQNGDPSDRPAYRTCAAEPDGLRKRLLPSLRAEFDTDLARKFDQRMVIGSDTIKSGPRAHSCTAAGSSVESSP